MAVAAYRRCQDLAAIAQGPGTSSSRSPGPSPDCMDLRQLTSPERGLIALLVFGGLRYREVSRELGIRPADVAELLRTALCRLVPADGSRTGSAAISR
jgi:transposase